MYNTLSFPQRVEQQSTYGSRFPKCLSQSRICQYRNYSIYSPLQHQSQFNNYNYQNQSIATNFSAFTPSYELTISNRHLYNVSRRNSYNLSKNRFSDNTNSIRMYYCETCRIGCTGYNSYQAHVQGSKHKRKETSSQHQSVKENTFRCELCEMTCTSFRAYQAHLSGMKHYKAVKLYRKSDRTVSKNLYLPPIPKKDLQMTTTTNEQQSSENNLNFVGVEYIVTSYDNKETAAFYYCKLCECKLNGLKAKNEHLTGKRHQLSYKQKMNSNTEVTNKTNNTSSSSKQYENEFVATCSTRPIYNNNDDKLGMNDDTKYLMELYELIMPTEAFFDAIEKFVCAVEAALKSCSDQFDLNQLWTTRHNLGSLHNKSSLLEVSRVGTLAKDLVIKNDRFFHLVMIYTIWPTMNIFENIFSTLFDNFNESWQSQINILRQKEDEVICVYANTLEGPMSVSISFTSLCIQETESVQTSEQLLSRANCLKALHAINSVRWFKNHSSKRQNITILIRCLRYKTKLSLNWKSLPSEAIEILIENIWSESVSISCIFRRILHCLSSGLLLSNGHDLRIPWQTNAKSSIFNKLTNQKRNDITQEAQKGLRFMIFGKLNHWFEQHDVQPKTIKSTKKRPCSHHDNQILAKRQCIEAVNLNKK